MDNIAELAQVLAIPPKSIDLIPGDGQEWLETFPDNQHAPFLFVEGNLGIPEKALYQTYVAAVKALGNPSLYRQRTLSADERSRVLELTSIILLANPTHQTALNLRKGVILNIRAYSGNQVRLNRACHAELKFIASLLSVKQCAKVSMLWHHRRVLLAHTFSSRSPGFDASADKFSLIHFTDDYFISNVDLPISALREEFDLSAHACEVYLRNYFAWHHRWLCFQSCLNGYARLCSQFHSTDSVRPTMVDMETLVSSEIANAKLWIERHVSDFSAVDYVCRIVEAIESSQYRPLHPHFEIHPDPENDAYSESGSIHAPKLLRHALGLVRSYPSHESLWLYLRQALQILASVEQPGSVHGITDDMRKGDELARALLADAAQKCQVLHQESVEPRTEDAIVRESHLIEKHALRFLLWQSRQQTRVDYDFLPSSCLHLQDACKIAIPPGHASEDKAVELLRIISSVE